MRHRRPILLAGVWLLGATRLAAQPLPLGADFRVNTYTTNAQYFPDVAGFASGFVVVWSGPGATDPDGVYAQRFDVSGQPVGSEFRVNTGTTGKQDIPVVAAQDSGEFVVAWEGQDESGYAIYAQRYDAAGLPVDVEFRVNTYTTNSQQTPAISANPDNGNFVIAWESPGDGGSVLEFGIFAQRYSGTGAPIGGNFQVNTYATSNQKRAAVAVSRFSDFVIAWGGPGATDDHGIFAQRFGPTGAPVASEFRVNTSTSTYPEGEKVVIDAQGRYLVAWHDIDRNGIYGQRFDHSGNALGGELQVSAPTTAAFLDAPAITMETNDSFLVFWTEDFTSVFGRRIVQGTYKGPQFTVDSYPSSFQSRARAGRISSSRFVVVWGGGDLDSDVRARVYCIPRGDVNFDGIIDVADVFYLINSLFAGGPAPVVSGDVNGLNGTDVADIFYLINYLFAGGAQPICL